MKNFDLEKALAGYPVCTRDGHKARIICFDARGGAYPVVALVDFGDDGEGPVSYTTNGQVRLGLETEFDLFMAHVKHDGLVNIYKTEDGVITSGRTFDNEEKARAYDMALEAMSDIIPDENGLVHIRPSDIFSELKESENERVRKSIIHLVKKSQEQGGYALHKDEADKMLIWLEEQCEKYKWTQDDEQYLLVCKNALAKYQTTDRWDANIISQWLEEKVKPQKQADKPKKMSIWKHWKDGIAGGAEGEQIFLTKIGRIYSISSCLGCECDYIELSELDKL